MTITFTVPGTPIGKGRPRFARKTGHAYTPEKTRTWEGILRSAALDAMKDQRLLEGPVEVDFKAFFPIPQSWPEWKRKGAIGCLIEPTTKPDIDNIVKTKDALNGIVFRDDSQVVRLRASKCYHPRPCLEITVTELNRLPAQVTKRAAAERYS